MVILDIAQVSVQILWKMDTRSEVISAQLVNEAFGTNLAALRKSRFMSQAELGKLVGLSRGTISNLESGIQNVQVHQVFSFALILNAPVSELLPTLSEVTVYGDSIRNSDRLFLDLVKRQLIEISSAGDDDENA